MSCAIGWVGRVTATSSLAHGGQTRGTISLLRREQIRDRDGDLVHVPVVSGNAVRGRLRRIGADLLNEAIDYEGQIPLAAAQVLRGGGGAVTKTTREPLSGARLRDVRTLVPQLAVFGGATGGRIIDGALQVGKLMPDLAQTEHLTGRPGPDVFTATQIETYTRTDEATTSGFHAGLPGVATPLRADGSVDVDELTRLDRDTPWSEAGPMLFRVETFPAGTQFTTWVRLDRTTDITAAFFAEALSRFSVDGRVGGRAGIGLGVITADWTSTTPPPDVDWRAWLQERRDEVMTAITALT